MTSLNHSGSSTISVGSVRMADVSHTGRWCLSLLLLFASTVVSAQDFRVASLNVHYVARGQDDLAWERRRDAVKAAVGDIDADIFAFQEMETFVGGSYNQENRQLDWVLAHYPEYRAGAITDDASTFPNTQPILYRADRFTLVDQGWFFYSETPDQIYSNTFNGSYPAFTTWAVLRDLRSGRTLKVVNNHLDYGSGSNRRQSADLIIDRLSSDLENNQPLVLVGDFNAPWFWAPMGRFRAAGLEVVSPDGPTFHFNRGLGLIPAIDHILVSNRSTIQAVSDVERLTADYSGIFPSDHYPIWADLRFDRTSAD